MPGPGESSTFDVAALRQRHYNATLAEVDERHAGLRIMRVRADAGPLDFEPGQYSVLGLGTWEACRVSLPSVRTAGAMSEWDTAEASDELKSDGRGVGMLQRAYSFSWPMLDTADNLLRPGVAEVAEFLIAMVPGARQHPAGLTPRLFSLAAGDRLLLSSRVVGSYSLRSVRPDEDVIFAATGTGEAPHNAMLAELLARGFAGRIAAITCVRHRRDLAYEATHRRLERQFSNYRYVGLTTRDVDEQTSASTDDWRHLHLQDFFSHSSFTDQTGVRLDPARTHVFLCGNPNMVGAPRRQADGSHAYSHAGGMVELLEVRGFVCDRPRVPGNIHFEKYW